MIGQDDLLQGRQNLAASFEEDQDLWTLSDLALPPIVGFESWDEIGASDQAFLQGNASESASRSPVGSGDQNNNVTKRRRHNPSYRGRPAGWGKSISSLAVASAALSVAVFF